MKTKKDWLAAAKNIAVTIDGQPHVATPKIFSTGSVGYMLSGKVVLDNNKHQVSCSIVVVGSKEWPSGE